MKSIIDEIYSHILDKKKEFTNQELLREFFKIESDNDDMAGKIVEPLLKPDARFKQLEDSKWTAVKKITVDQLPISEASFILFYIDDIERPGDRKLYKADDIFSVLKSYSSFFLYEGGTIDEDIQVRDVLKRAGRYIFLPYDLSSLGLLKKIYRVISPLQPEIITLSIKSLVSVLFPGKQLKTWDDIVKEFGIMNFHSENPSSRVKTLRHIFDYILNIVGEKGITKVEELIEFSIKGRKKVDFSRYDFDREYLKSIPRMPGVYLFFNSDGRVIYVGKTNNLQIRINSYFWNTGESVEKIQGILDRLSGIKYKVLGSDLEALVQEYRLIDAHKPRFNKQMNIPERPLDISDKILILPSGMEGMLKLYFLSNRIPLLDHDFDCSNTGTEVNDILKKIQKPAENVFDPLKVIALFYMRRYEESLNTIDIDRYGSADKIVKALQLHCKNLNEISRNRTLYI